MAKVEKQWFGLFLFFLKMSEKWKYTFIDFSTFYIRWNHVWIRTKIHIHKVSDRSVGNFHNLVFCIFLINQVGFSMFDTTIMYSQLSRMYRTLKFWLRLMFRVKKCWNSGAQICHEYLHMCRVCIFAKYDIDLSGSTHCCKWWRSMLEYIVQVVMVCFHCSYT